MDKEVRLIGSQGEQLGIVPISKAREMALNLNLDLVKVADKAVPPVCKILDYGKYKFEMSKREKESKKNQRTAELKEVRLSVNIDTHDFNTKVSHAMRFAGNGDKIKVSIRFRGREMGHPEIGYDLMNRFAQACEEFAIVDRPAKLEGRSMMMFLSSKPQSSKSSSDAKSKKEESNIDSENTQTVESISQSIESENTQTIKSVSQNIENSKEKGSDGVIDVI